MTADCIRHAVLDTYCEIYFSFSAEMAGLFRFRLFFGRKRKFIFRLFLFYGRKSKIHFRSASTVLHQLVLDSAWDVKPMNLVVYDTSQTVIKVLCFTGNA